MYTHFRLNCILVLTHMPTYIRTSTHISIITNNISENYFKGDFYLCSLLPCLLGVFVENQSLIYDLIFLWVKNLFFWAFALQNLQLSKYLNGGCFIFFLYIFFSRAILELPWTREEKDDQNPKSLIISLVPNSYHTFITLDVSRWSACIIEHFSLTPILMDILNALIVAKWMWADCCCFSIF